MDPKIPDLEQVFWARLESSKELAINTENLATFLTKMHLLRKKKKKNDICNLGFFLRNWKSLLNSSPPCLEIQCPPTTKDCFDRAALLSPFRRCQILKPFSVIHFGPAYQASQAGPWHIMKAILLILSHTRRRIFSWFPCWSYTCGI